MVVPATLVTARLVAAFGIGLARNCFLHSSASLSSVVKEGVFLAVLGLDRRDIESAEGPLARGTGAFGAFVAFECVVLLGDLDLPLSILAKLALVGRGWTPLVVLVLLGRDPLDTGPRLDNVAEDVAEDDFGTADFEGTLGRANDVLFLGGFALVAAVTFSAESLAFDVAEFFIFLLVIVDASGRER